MYRAAKTDARLILSLATVDAIRRLGQQLLLACERASLLARRQAAQPCDKADLVQVDPHCGMCHGQYGDMYKDSHKISKSIEHYTLSAQLLPHMPAIFCNLVYTKLFACDWTNYDADFERLMKMVHEETDPSRPVPRHLCVQPLQAVLYRCNPLHCALISTLQALCTHAFLCAEIWAWRQTALKSCTRGVILTGVRRVGAGRYQLIS